MGALDVMRYSEDHCIPFTLPWLVTYRENVRHRELNPNTVTTISVLTGPDVG